MANKTKPSSGCIHGVPLGKQCQHCEENTNMIVAIQRFRMALRDVDDTIQDKTIAHLKTILKDYDA